MTQESSPSRVAGVVYRTFIYKDKKLLLSRSLRIKSFIEEEAFVLAKRLDPKMFGLRVYQDLPSSERVNLWEGCARAAMSGIPNAAEWLAYNNSTWKSAYVFWHCLDDKHKTDKETKEPIDLLEGVAWAAEFLVSLPPEKQQELFVLIDIVSQDSAIKNSSGRTAPASPANLQTGTPASTDSPPFTPSSENDTDTSQET